MTVPESFVPREMCMRCLRPRSVCYCDHLPSLETKNRVVLLQHPREEGMPIGTAHMAHLSLQNSELHVGIQFEHSKDLERALSDPARPAALLYPGKDAINVLESPPDHPVTLVVVDGTWSQAKKLVRLNPFLAKLPRYAFAAPKPSEYRIRREPLEEYVSTIEALVLVLGALERDPEKFQVLLRPFRAMIDKQLEYEKLRPNPRKKTYRPKVKRDPPLFAAFREDAPNLVCILGEANAWPYRSQERDHLYPDELIQWVAVRLRTGETFDEIAKPSHPLAPRTVDNVRLPAELLANGISHEELLTKWNEFLQEGDVLCAWGRYAMRLLRQTGGNLPTKRHDLRAIARDLSKAKVGTIEDYMVSTVSPGSCLGDPVNPTLLPTNDRGERLFSHPLARGRAGGRLEQSLAVAQYFLTLTR